MAVTVTDKPIGSLIMQCNETDWEFMIRMASQLGVPAFTNIIARTPHIYIGLPPSSQSKAIDASFCDYGKNEGDYRTHMANASGGTFR